MKRKLTTQLGITAPHTLNGGHLYKGRSNGRSAAAQAVGASAQGRKARTSGLPLQSLLTRIMTNPHAD